MQWCLSLFVLIFTLDAIDYYKKRKPAKKQFVSFIIPCFNDGNTLEKTIEGIYNSYSKNMFEMIVIDDKSTDNSLQILKSLRKKYRFRLIINKENMGKSISLNNAISFAQGNILFFVDADTILNKKSVHDTLLRLSNKKVGAVSCPYRPMNRGFIALMLEIEYNIILFLQGAYNITSGVNLWGGCIAIKKDAFKKTGSFSPNAITEDIDLALKLNEVGYSVEQSFFPVYTYVPETIRSWYNQEIRWASGSIQAILKHFKTWIKNPLQLVFLFLFSVLSIFYVIAVIREITFLNNLADAFQMVTTGATKLKNFELTGIYYGVIVLRNILSNLYFLIFSVPYVIPLIKKYSEVYKILYLIPFSLVYYPALSIVAVIGFVKGILRYNFLTEGKRAW